MLKKLYDLLAPFAENNADELEAIKNYYKLQDAIRCTKEKFRFFFCEEKSIMIDLEHIESVEDAEMEEMLKEKQQKYFAIRDFCDKAMKRIDKIISEEKKHSLDLNSLMQEIDGIAPEM